MPSSVLIGGEAGQGLVTVGQLLAKCLVRSGYYIVVVEDYQSRIRGGHNTYYVRFGDEEIHAPTESVDLLVAMNARSVELDAPRLSENGKIIADRNIEARDERVISVPFDSLTEKQYFNVAALGVVASMLGLDDDLVKDTVHGFFGKKKEEAAQKNEEALKNSFEWYREQSIEFPSPEKVAKPPSRLMLTGNQAVALGAASGGVKFFSFYPMTPSTGVALGLIAHADKTGIVVEQAEDEIAAINMAVGASFAGAPSMAATSGGGFALMTEGVSLAAMTETPVVINVAQRPAPATGLPTRTEQADLEFVLHSGHGEWPRAVYAPGDPAQCFHLTRKALEMAEKYQGPMFILTDQFITDSARAVEPFDIENLEPVRAGADEAKAQTPYKRYRFVEDGISPRLLPGGSENLVIADSDEHDETGHITEDHDVRNRMVQKRLKKGEGIRAEVIPPDVFGDENPDVLLLCWGSTLGVVREAVTHLKENGKTAAGMHFSQVWPLVPGQFIEKLEGAKTVVSVESNAFAQFARLIRRETGFHVEKTVLRYDGLPLTLEYVTKKLGGEV